MTAPEAQQTNLKLYIFSSSDYDMEQCAVVAENLEEAKEIISVRIKSQIEKIVPPEKVEEIMEIINKLDFEGKAK